MKLDQATISQNRAAAPNTSTWLSANAGSGKTRVLTDRVARLLLDGTVPQNILCLTYTKAAASEMQNRLFRRLGDWAMKPDGALAEDLQRMGVTGIGDPQRLAEARRLFARAIETPGGLRIQTIHSFCASLLRRFPLEAGVSPAFVEMDDRTATLLRQEVVEDLASGRDIDAVDAVAMHYTGEDLDDLTRAVVSHAEALSREVTRAEMLGWFDAPGDLSEAGVLSDVFDGTEGTLMPVLLKALQASAKPTDKRAADKLRGVDFKTPNLDALHVLQSVLLTGSGAKEPFSAKVGTFPTKDTRTRLGTAAEELDDLMMRVEEARPRVIALNAAERCVALYRFAQAFLPAYEARKRRRGGLDFDDLIGKTRDLLSDPAVADWVLYRLDGGLDHILVDEAQDTSPTQWQVIEQLAREFAAGQGTRDDEQRTIFVVGDKKQSIYSFQGADPQGFDRMRDVFRTRLENASRPFQRRELDFSFRSSQAILTLVDAVFGAFPDTQMDMGTRHCAFRADLPGRVDLWPTVEPAEKPEKKNWYDPLDIPTQEHHDLVLARNIADQIARSIESETIPLPDGTRRAVCAGDYLILVRRRAGLFNEIIRACKSRGLPIAGADRLKLGGELAVKDLASVLRFLATPEDDLSLAAALRSPLFGWTERDLYDLAADRPEPFLWAALRRSAEEHPKTMAILNDLRGQADFLRPYDLVERLLSRHDGRRHLLARLGPEAEDGIDSLLSQALAYEQREIPSLTGFLGWLETDDVEVKRQLDSAGDQIRVMTVHGAKGLESPIVILPDTAKRTPRIRDEVLRLEDGAAVWKSAAAEQPQAMRDALDGVRRDQAAEDLRLLYVAMTRAETWLIVAAAGDVGAEADSWHSITQRGLESLGADELDTPTGPGLRRVHLDWNRGSIVSDPPQIDSEPALPDWIDAPVAPPERPETLSPSKLGGAKARGADGSGDDQDAAIRRGSQVHLLLEHLPGIPKAHRKPIAAALLAESPEPASEAELDALVSEASGVLDHPDLGWLFAPDVLSEVDVTAALSSLGDQRIHGTIDKLVVTDTKVLAIDFKTNRVVPDTPADTPEGILRQMGAYAEALAQIYPDRQIETAVLWTNSGQMMRLPHDIVRAALHSATIS